MQDELGGKIMTKLVGVRAETYCYSSEDKKAKGAKKCVLNMKIRNKIG